MHPFAGRPPAHPARWCCPDAFQAGDTTKQRPGEYPPGRCFLPPLPVGGPKHRGVGGRGPYLVPYLFGKRGRGTINPFWEKNKGVGLNQMASRALPCSGTPSDAHPDPGVRQSTNGKRLHPSRREYPPIPKLRRAVASMRSEYFCRKLQPAGGGVAGNRRLAGGRYAKKRRSGAGLRRGPCGSRLVLDG